MENFSKDLALVFAKTDDLAHNEMWGDRGRNQKQ